MHDISKNSIRCILCYSNKTKKYWILKGWWQRYKCNQCNHTFTLWGIRWTYDDVFKKWVIENYCHRKQKVTEVLEHYWISSRTLIKWSKEHKKDCQSCKK